MTRSCKACGKDLPEGRDKRAVYCNDKCKRNGKYKARSVKSASCHPGKKLVAKGLCSVCYKLKNGYVYDKAHKRNWHLKSTYGIDQQIFDWVLAAQKNKCNVCEKELKLGGKRTKDHAVVDHDHITHKVRGIICHACNVAIGMFNDNPSVMVKAANYVMGYDLAEIRDTP